MVFKSMNSPKECKIKSRPQIENEIPKNVNPWMNIAYYELN
jgi:hypothetical protein